MLSNSAPTVVAQTTATTQASGQYIVRGTRNFFKVTLALFSAGLGTFAQLYCVQAILPMLSESFQVSPATSSLVLSVSTAMLAIGLLFTGALSDAVGRKNMMVTALVMAAGCTLASAFVDSWTQLLILRAAVGLALSGVAAVGITYLSEEIHPGVLAFAVGLYVSGNSIGGMSGRLLTGVLTDFTNWRVAIACIGLLSLGLAILFWKLLPNSAHHRRTKFNLRNLWLMGNLHFRDRGLPWLFLISFLLMGSFVTLFNYIGYRLMQAPWSLSQATVGLISIVYLAGSWSSPKAGALSGRYGRGTVFKCAVGLMLSGVILSLFSPLWILLPGLLLFTAGFFAAHAVASSWVGARAKRAKGLATSLYLFFYYAGSSLAGTAGGYFWHLFGWAGLAGFIFTMLSLALAAAFRLAYRTQTVE